MITPLDAIDAIHRAFRRDMAEIDELAYAAADGEGDLSGVVQRLQFFSEILKWHDEGEDEAVFPELDKLAPHVARSYFLDHREFDTMTAGLAQISVASSPLLVARSTAALTELLRIHLDKEDQHLYPILRAGTSPEQQGSIVLAMAQKSPPERAPETVGWLFPLLSLDDREIITRVWMQLMPAPVFAAMKGLIETTTGGRWTELVSRIPELGAPAAWKPAE